MQISKERMAHMHGVAEYMYKHAEDFGLENKDEMYLLGLLHDIGYLYGSKEEHEQRGAELLDDYKYVNFVQAHGLTPQEYKACYGYFDYEIPKEMLLLWTADMMIDLTGEEVGFEERLKGMEQECGLDSDAYRICKEIIDYLKNRESL